MKKRSNSVMPPWSTFEEGGAGCGTTVNDSSDDDQFLYYFDPNDRRYRCCCQQSHSTTGVRIIAGMLCVTVILEFWQLCWYSISSEPAEENDIGGSAENATSASAIQLFVGAAIAASVLYALWRENAVFLLPYLLLQAVGLTAVFVILFAMIYITLSNDLDTIRAFLESHSPNVINSYNQRYLIYMGWTMVGSCTVLLALQWWLISIVFACWRYFRDKRNFGYAKGYNTSSFVVFCRPSSKKKTGDVESGQTVKKSQKQRVSAVRSEAIARRNFHADRRANRSVSMDWNPSTFSQAQSITTASTQLPHNESFS